ncbi:DUF126 domain-containing protein [Candidatus Bathyarchaeota archaeon]|nr:DUF126 domain-containing protein [Candidatus Bathyarchaeota archaeon]
MVGRVISRGEAYGEALVSKQPLSFFGGVDEKTGIVTMKGHELEGKCIKDKILIFPKGVGSTAGSWKIYSLSKNKVAPKAIINQETEPIIAVGAILAGIPLIDKLNIDPLKVISDGDLVRITPQGKVIVQKKE